MLVGKDLVGGERSCWLWRMVSFCPTKNIFFAQKGPLSVRSQHKSQQTICHVAADPISKIVARKASPMLRSNRNSDCTNSVGHLLMFSLNRTSNTNPHFAILSCGGPPPPRNYGCDFFMYSPFGCDFFLYSIFLLILFSFTINLSS